MYLEFQSLDEIATRITTCELTASVRQVVQTIHQQGKKEIFDIFTSLQRSAWGESLVKPFDASSLGNVRYKALGFLKSTRWLNSKPISLSKLEGSVVVVHFMAIGRINCKRNHP